jgi:hypothetical protein
MFADARKLERIDLPHGAHDEREAGHLDACMQHGPPAAGVIHLAADGLPEAADAYQEQAGDPDICRPNQAIGNYLRNPSLDGSAREYTVVYGEGREEERVGRNRRSMESGVPGPGEDERVRAKGERADEYRAATPSKHALEKAHINILISGLL